MNVTFRVTSALFICGSDSWNIKVDYNLYFRHINTSCKHVSCNNNMNFALSELGHYCLSFLIAHITEHDGWFEIILAQSVLDYFTELFRVNKNDGLSQSTRIKDVHDEVNLLLWLAFKLILCNMVQMKLFFLLSNWCCIFTEFINLV